MLGMSSVSAQVAAFQEGLSSMNLVNYYTTGNSLITTAKKVIYQLMSIIGYRSVS
jgi:hypothetical protein